RKEASEESRNQSYPRKPKTKRNTTSAHPSRLLENDPNLRGTSSGSHRTGRFPAGVGFGFTRVSLRPSPTVVNPGGIQAALGGEDRRGLSASRRARLRVGAGAKRSGCRRPRRARSRGIRGRRRARL